MRYIFISDVHGQFDTMLKALEQVDFDKNKDTLIHLGDAFDRGPQSWEVLEFLMNCPHRILIWGNHDLRLKELLLGEDWCQIYDCYNGVTDTLRSFETHVFGQPQIHKDLNTRFIDMWQHCDLLQQYMRECVYAIEFSNLIGTHAWLPHGKWRRINLNTFAGQRKWYDATWSNTEQEIRANNWPDKPLIVGHWYTWDLHEKFERITEPPVFDIFIIPNRLIAIDGCSHVSQVNTYIYESDETPILYGKSAD